MNHDRHTPNLAAFFSSFMAERSGLGEGGRRELQNCCSLLVASMQAGHTCLHLTALQKTQLLQSSLVSSSADTPLVIFNNSLYLSRYFHYEQRLAKQLAELSKITYHIEDLDERLDTYFPPSPLFQDQQREAARVSLCNGLSIISGGPGTGKTTTVTRIAALLLDYYGPSYRIALAAPTGKAAMRLRESIANQVASLNGAPSISDALPREAVTLHRLLGVQKQSVTFTHNAENPLPWDVVVIDEASMVDLAMMSKLVDAIGPGARLVLLGDKDQLASVESGAVLSECVRVLSANVTELRTAHRFNREILSFARNVRDGDAEHAQQALDNAEVNSIKRGGSDWLLQSTEQYANYLDTVRNTGTPRDLKKLFRVLNSFRLLCAVKKGRFGVNGITERIERILATRGFRSIQQNWYPGRPIMITQNDYDLGLFNGDMGICLQDSDKDNEYVVWFEREANEFQRFLPARLPAHQTAWAMTVHKSQGSEFTRVMLVLPPVETPVVTRELIYTGITRAREEVQICAESELLCLAIERTSKRLSGLAAQLERYLSKREIVENA